jgi:hypothetical protein
MTKDDVLRKIKDLLALGDSARNNSEEEAKAAMLKAQQLMAKYDISTEEVEGEEEEQYAHEMCEHKWDYAYRVPLANVLAKNFRCMVYFRGKSVVFMGHPSDAKICRATFEFAYKFIQKKGNSVYNKRYSMGYPTKGVFNSYAHGFIVGLQEAFNVQCKALAIVTPPDVIDEFKNLSKNWGTRNCKDISEDATDYQVFREGRIDGKKFMDKDKLPE